MSKKSAQTKPKQSSFQYSLPAIRAIQAGQEFFTTAVPFGVLAKLLNTTLASENEQASHNRERSKSISEYIVRNPQSYVLTAITLSVHGKCSFEGTSGSDSEITSGTLTIPMNTSLQVHDGRHRAKAIADAVAKSPSIANESISVVIFRRNDKSETARQFSDIRTNQRKYARSERILNDPEDAIAEITRSVIDLVPAFKDSIEMVKTTISNRSRNLFTFSALYQANQILLADAKDQSPKEQHNLAVDFWLAVQAAMPDWTSDRLRADLRQQTIHAHGVTLCAIATVGASLMVQFPKLWKRKIGNLREIDWSRENAELWEGKAMFGGRMTKSAASIDLTAKTILDRIQ
jgi:DNA sulfur modification protein DndB